MIILTKTINNIMIKFIKILVLAFVFNLSSLAAQQFGAGVVAGLTAAQINGDDSAGYNKLGLTAGLLTTIRIKDNQYIGIEMLYSQRGSQDKYLSQTGSGLFVNLKYVSVPVFFGIKDWFQENDDYYKVHFRGGLNYSRLIDAEWNRDKLDPRATSLLKNDFSFLLGATFFLNKKLGIEGRYNRSINLLARNDTYTYKYNLRSHFLSFAILYRL